MDERRTNFSRLVQAKLAEFAARGTAHSPPAYGAVEKLAFQEVERLGRMMLEGYQQALCEIGSGRTANRLGNQTRSKGNP